MVWDARSLAVLEQRIAAGDRKASTTSWGIRRRRRQAAEREPDPSGSAILLFLVEPLIFLVALLSLVAKRLIEGRAGSGDGRWEE